MEFYAYEDVCLCSAGGTIPKGAYPVESPFSPLVFLLRGDINISRGIFALGGLSELKLSGPALLRPLEGNLSELDAYIKKNGAMAADTAFSKVYDVMRAYRAKRRRFTLTLVGLGDVGGTVLTGLKLLGRDIDEIKIYDPNEAQCARYEMEMNQVLSADGEGLPKVSVCAGERLFECDAFLFTASRGVPPLGAKGDVRMAQYELNREMLSSYARQARDTGFCGLFAQISDPVDHLCRAVFLESNRDENGKADGGGLLSSQIQGYGLGVMRARARYYAPGLGANTEKLRVYGPHGAGLIAANEPDAGYDDDISLRLTEAAATANLRVRELGFKPYIAPGLSSACVSVLRTLRGEWHDGAVPLGGAYFGCESRFGKNGLELKQEKLCDTLFERIEQSYYELKEFDY